MTKELDDVPSHNGQSDAVDLEGGSHAAATAAPGEAGSSKPEASHCTCSACSKASRRRRTCCAGKPPHCRGPRARDGPRNAAYFKVPRQHNCESSTSNGAQHVLPTAVLQV
jgi:hypothetical protein